MPGISRSHRLLEDHLEEHEYDIVRFRNGYGPTMPDMDVEWKGIEKVVRRDGRSTLSSLERSSA